MTDRTVLLPFWSAGSVEGTGLYGANIVRNIHWRAYKVRGKSEGYGSRVMTQELRKQVQQELGFEPKLRHFWGARKFRYPNTYGHTECSVLSMMSSWSDLFIWVK